MASMRGDFAVELPSGAWSFPERALLSNSLSASESHAGQRSSQSGDRVAEGSRPRARRERRRAIDKLAGQGTASADLEAIEDSPGAVCATPPSRTLHPISATGTEIIQVHGERVGVWRVPDGGDHSGVGRDQYSYDNDLAEAVRGTASTSGSSSTNKVPGGGVSTMSSSPPWTTSTGSTSGGSRARSPMTKDRVPPNGVSRRRRREELGGGREVSGGDGVWRPP